MRLMRAPQAGGDISQSQGSDTVTAPLASTGDNSELAKDAAPIEIEEQQVSVAVVEVMDNTIEPPNSVDTISPEPLPEPIILTPEPMPPLPIIIESETPQPSPHKAEPEHVYVELDILEPVPGIPPPAHPPINTGPEPQITVTVDPHPHRSPRHRERPPAQSGTTYAFTSHDCLAMPKRLSDRIGRKRAYSCIPCASAHLPTEAQPKIGVRPIKILARIAVSRAGRQIADTSLHQAATYP